MSRFSQRLLATCSAAALAVAISGGLSARAAGASISDSTWTGLGALPERLDSPVFALAVNPADGQVLLAGTQTGSIYRSGDGGTTWKQVKRDLGRGVTTIAFNPFKPGQVMAGVRGDGAWRSIDSGQTWGASPGLGPSSARVFGFTKTLIAAGTDRGVFVARDNSAWVQAGLPAVSVDALAVAAVNDPSRLMAGADASPGSEALPLFQSADSGVTWGSVNAPPASSSSLVASLIAGPLPPKLDTRPLLMGTNAGLYVSIDNGTTWTQLSGAGGLPSVDFNLAGFVTTHPERFYVASDGGGSDAGGLWSTADGGLSFRSLKAPVPSVTAMSLTNDEVPVLYVATFRSADHLVSLWAYRDTGGSPIGPATALPDPTQQGATEGSAGGTAHPDWLLRLVFGPEGPYLVVGVAALVVLLLAIIAYVRRGQT